MNKIFLYTFLFFLFCGNAIADTKDREIKLDQLFEQLKKSSNASVAFEIEMKIWNIWSTHPTQKELTQSLANGSNLMSQGKLEKSYKVFSTIIDVAPNWAEGWNKRATVFYLMGRFNESEEDILQTLKLEPRHFGALSGQGLIRMALEDWSGAITVLEAGMRIHPHMPGVIRNLEYVRKKQKESMT